MANQKLDDTEQLALDCLRRAVAEALERKHRLGQYAVVWRDGRPQFIGPNPPAESNRYSSDGLKFMVDHYFAVCTENTGYEASLELRKLYEVVSDSGAEKHGQLRVIDESGEEYLYPKSFFVRLELPQQVIDRIVQTGC